MSIITCDGCGSVIDTDYEVEQFFIGHPMAPQHDYGAWLCRLCAPKEWPPTPDVVPPGIEKHVH